jgi:hypothetical protein
MIDQSPFGQVLSAMSEMKRDIARLQGVVSPAPVNYVVNQSFEDSNDGTVMGAATAWTLAINGWSHLKTAPGDIVIATQNGTTFDAEGGGLRSLQIVKTGTAGSYYLTQFLMTRITRYFWNKTFTIAFRVRCSAVGIIQLCTYNGTFVGGPSNTLVNTWETIQVTYTNFNPNTAGTQGTVYVDNVRLVDGSVLSSVAYASPPTNAGDLNTGPAAAVSKAPKCNLSPSAVYPAIGAGVWTALPMNRVETDTDNMYSASNKITFRTDGRYEIHGAVAVFGVTGGTGNPITWMAQVWDQGGNSLPKNNLYGFPYGMSQYDTGNPSFGQYQSKEITLVEDFIAGNWIELRVYVYSGTLNILFNGTLLQASMIGD